MQRIFSLATLALVVLLLLSLPKGASDNLRFYAVASFTPAWNLAHRFGKYLQERPIFASTVSSSKETAQLQLEIQHLRSQLEVQSAWKGWVEHVQSQIAVLGQLKAGPYQPFAERRWEEMNDLVQRQFFALLAPVIYRDPSSWSSSLWIQVGQKDNESLGRTVVAKNSPVVVGSSLVGVVEFVGAEQSRVRLITDSGLIVSVRAVRGKTQDIELSQLVERLQTRISCRSDLPFDASQKALLANLLHRLQTHVGSEDGYCAKGHLQGSSSPFWRSRGLYLKGVGFNYDYPDQEGPARELRTGRPVGTQGAELPLLKEGDLLVTSGLDGVFPPGIQVGIVTKIDPLLEGSYAYDLEARPTVPHFHDLGVVFVLPPLTLE
ncbi:MAG: rod shape-determining protein MreC [Chlamydiales bacterium]|nr:rod shape-determining protein MreC [Chlamydiales bacterium]